MAETCKNGKNETKCVQVNGSCKIHISVLMVYVKFCFVCNFILIIIYFYMNDSREHKIDNLITTQAK
jgi:hypothetical protein